MKSAHGFTLIELIVVVVLLGVMAVGAGLLIVRPIEAYNDQFRRQQLVDSAEMALRKVAMDIRRAVPNSIRINSGGGDWALEMIAAVDGARYRDEFDPDVSPPDENDVLRFSQADDQFKILGVFPNFSSWPALSGLSIAIYSANQVASPPGELEIYVDAATGGGTGLITAAGISSVNLDAGEHRVTLANPHQFDYQSPGQRLFVVEGPVSYVCDRSAPEQRLVRFSGYSFRSAQLANLGAFTAAGLTGSTVVAKVAACEINYQPGSSQRSGLITIALTLRDAAGEQVRLLHQVHVDNVP